MVWALPTSRTDLWGRAPRRKLELLFPEEGGWMGDAGASEALTAASPVVSQALPRWRRVVITGWWPHSCLSPWLPTARHWWARRWGAGETQEGV